MRNPLFSLIQTNARKGSFRAEASDGGSTLYLYDMIVGSDIEAEWWGGVSPMGFRRALEATSGPVTLRINSPGGDVFAGRAIAAAVAEHREPVFVVVDGYAASASSLVAIAGARLAMQPGTFLMIHNSWTLGIGNAAEFTRIATLLDKVDRTIAESYAAKSGHEDVDAFLAMMAEETWFTPAEAVEIGLADEAIAEATSDREAPAAAWNLAAYAKAPAASKAPPATTGAGHLAAAHRRRQAEARVGFRFA